MCCICMCSCIYVAGFPGGVIMNDFIMKQLACVFYTKAVYFCVYIRRSGASGSDDMHVFNSAENVKMSSKYLPIYTPSSNIWAFLFLPTFSIISLFNCGHPGGDVVESCWTFYFLFSEWLMIFSSVYLLSHVRLFATPGTAACQASLSITNSWSLLKFMSIKSVMLSNWFSVVPFSSHFQTFPASGSFPMGQFFTSGGQRIGTASASVLPMNIQGWFPLGWTGWISLQSKGLSRVFSNTTVQKHQFLGAQLSLWSNSHTHTWLLEKP